METTNGVYLLIDNELRQVTDYSNNPDARVAVVYQGTVVVIPPKNLGEADYYEAMEIAEANGAKLGDKPEWIIIDSLLDKANEALKLLGHDIIRGAYWTSDEYASYYAWFYTSSGILNANLKGSSTCVRPLSSFPLDTLKTK